MADRDANSGQEELVAETVSSKKFPVLEIFGPTIQGEGSVIGRQTMFIRFGGCDYRCTSCDSLHAVLPQLIKKHARRLTAREIADEVMAKSKYCRMVTLSGGNPCMWDLTELCHILNQAGYILAVETQGTIWQDWLATCMWITVSPKGPGMGEKFEEDKFMKFGRELSKFNKFGKRIAVKVVIFSQQDIEFAKHIAKITGMPDIYLSLGNPYPPQPQKGSSNTPPNMTADLLNRMRVLYEDIQNEPELANAIFLPQLHVLLWANEQGR